MYPSHVELNRLGLLPTRTILHVNDRHVIGTPIAGRAGIWVSYLNNFDPFEVQSSLRSGLEGTEHLHLSSPPLRQDDRFLFQRPTSRTFSYLSTLFVCVSSWRSSASWGHGWWRRCWRGDCLTSGDFVFVTIATFVVVIWRKIFRIVATHVVILVTSLDIWWLVAIILLGWFLVIVVLIWRRRRRRRRGSEGDRAQIIIPRGQSENWLWRRHDRLRRIFYDELCNNLTLFCRHGDVVLYCQKRSDQF